MAKRIFLKINRGSFDEGFDVTLQIAKENQPFSTGIDFQLPQSPENICEIYQSLKKNYSYLRRCLTFRNSERQRLGQRSGTNDIAKLQEECRLGYQKLIKSVKLWLNQYDCVQFRQLNDRLLQELGDSQGKQEEVRFFIQAKDDLLNKLPWHEWSIFTSTQAKVEIALSPPNFDRVEKVTPVGDKTKLRILVILGDSEGLNLEEERANLEEGFQDAEVRFVPEPTRQVVSDRLGYESWDILFFAGHSSSEDEKGRIYTRTTPPKEYLTIDNLKPGLKDAIERGLKLAIFNSCDGLQLAYDLAKLNIPQLIVMREPVPDRVAQRFLKHFLKAFYNNEESLYQAVRKARTMLMTEGLEDEFPGAAWMPIICQNPAEPSLVWSKPTSWEDKKVEDLAKIRQKLLLAKSGKEIQETLFDVEIFLERYPKDPKARTLQAEIKQALDRENAEINSPQKTWKTEHTLTDHSDIIKSVAIHPDGQILASCSLDQTIKVWNLATGELLENLTQHSGGVTCVTFSSDGKTLASSSANPDGTIKLWDTQTWQLKRSLKADDWVVLSIWSIALSPNGKTLVSGHHADSTVKVWNLETGELRHTLRGHVWAVHDVAIAPDGNIIASASFDSNIKLWNLHTGREIRNLNGPGDGPIGWPRSFFSDQIVYAVTFSPDGQTLASGGAKQPIKLWRLSNGELKSNLTGHTDDVYAVAFSPDGKYLASGSADRTIRIWDLFTGEPIHTLGHSNTVYSLAFSPDGQTLVSGSGDRTIKIWRFST
ncbi:MULTISPECIES: CHAT domain-containing protein [unclassified Microcoleus]|uniref:WD40 domain-containing protein n=1 Tax=unclassified Microcoleus TaxID=2642155 RepID=UPI002FCFE13A